MSADVLMTGDGGDLLPGDLIADTRTSPRLVTQQIETVLSIAEGEWFINILEGIDWIGYFTDKLVNTSALAQDVRRVAQEIPEVVISAVTSTQSGRTLIVNMEGYIHNGPFRGTLAADTSAPETVGDNGILVPLTLRWSYSEI